MAGFDRIDEIVSDAVLGGQAPGIVAGVSDGIHTHVACAGVRAVSGAPMLSDTLFRIASMTRVMTAVAVLALVEDASIALDEPIARWLPELAEQRVLRRPDGPLDDTVAAHRAVTVRDLLTNTGGFGMQGAMFMSPQHWPIHAATIERGLHTFGPPQPAAMLDPDTWIARLGELPLMAQPGERWLYQTASQVLGVLVGRASGRRLSEVMHERIFDKLEMDDTGFHTSEIDRLATAYERLDGDLIVMDAPEGQWSSAPAFDDGGAGLLSSVDDVLAFGRMLLDGGAEVLSPSTVAQMTRNHLTDSQRQFWPGFDLLSGRGWGFGVSVFDGRTPGTADWARHGPTSPPSSCASSRSPNGPGTRPGRPPSATQCWTPRSPLRAEPAATADISRDARVIMDGWHECACMTTR